MSASQMDFRALPKTTVVSSFFFSQGDRSDFKGIENVRFHLDEDVFSTFHHLVSADVIVMAKSSFSWVAALLSKGIKIHARGSYHGKMSSWLSDRNVVENLRVIIKR